MPIVQSYPILLSVGDVYGGELGWKPTGWVDSLWVAVPSHLFCFWDGWFLCELLYVLTTSFATFFYTLVPYTAYPVKSLI